MKLTAKQKMDIAALENAIAIVRKGGSVTTLLVAKTKKAREHHMKMQRIGMRAMTEFMERK